MPKNQAQQENVENFENENVEGVENVETPDAATSEEPTTPQPEVPGDILTGNLSESQQRILDEAAKIDPDLPKMLKEFTAPKFYRIMKDRENLIALGGDKDTFEESLLNNPPQDLQEVLNNVERLSAEIDAAKKLREKLITDKFEAAKEENKDQIDAVKKSVDDMAKLVESTQTYLSLIPGMKPLAASLMTLLPGWAENKSSSKSAAATKEISRIRGIDFTVSQNGTAVGSFKNASGAAMNMAKVAKTKDFDTEKFSEYYWANNNGAGKNPDKYPASCEYTVDVNGTEFKVVATKSA